MSDQAPDDETLRSGELDPRTLLDAGLIAELIVDIRRLALGVETFANQLVATNDRVDELRSLRRRNALLGLGLAMFALAAVLGTWAFLGRLTTAADDARVAAAEARQTGRFIAECTAPAPAPEDAIDTDDLVHECYDASRARTIENIENLDRAAVDAAICAITNVDGTPATIEACYEARKANRPTTQ